MGATAAIKETKPVRGRLTAEERREAIMGAAESVFAEYGYHETKIDEVAKVGDVSKALVYQHFPTKRDLYQALLASSGDELLRRVEAVAQRPGSREERLQGGINDFFGFVAEHPGAARLLFHNATDPDVVGELDRVRDEAAEMISGMISEEVPPSREGDAIPVDVTVAMLSHQLMGALQALAVWWLDNGEMAGREDVVRMAMELTWLGLDRLTEGERWSAQ